MLKEINDKWAMINQLNKEFDDVYHKIALHYKLTDSNFWILYTLYDKKEGCTQKEICADWCYSKQTINTAIKELEKKEYIFLNYEDGNRKYKKIFLTSKGLEIAENTVKKVMEIENIAFSKIDKNEFDRVINFFQVQLSSFKEEVKKIL